MRSFTLRNPVRRGAPPRWDLNVVLDSLTKAPYEPLEQASFRDLTKKTLFLVSLATARRVGELQALSKNVASLGHDLSLSYLPHFVAKTESPSNPLPRHFVLKSLEDFVGDMPYERLLCPVRVLRFYLGATTGLVPRSPNLFVSPRCKSRPLSKNALSFFLREVISGAGALGSAEGPAPRAHSIRAVSTSCRFFKNWAVGDVLAAATWKSNSVFASYYLRDVAYVLGDRHSLGPFVSAGGVV